MDEKILIIDDDEAIRDSLSELLHHEGYVVTACKDAKEVDVALEKELPDIILLDVFLSGYDGGKISRQLKGQKSTKRIPIIILSAHYLPKAVIRGYKANDYLQKPFEPDILLEKIEKNIKPHFSLLDLFS